MILLANSKIDVYVVVDIWNGNTIHVTSSRNEAEKIRSQVKTITRIETVKIQLVPDKDTK